MRYFVIIKNWLKFYKNYRIEKCIFIVIESHCFVIKSVWKIGVELKIDYLGNYLSLLRTLLVEWIFTPQWVTCKIDRVTCLFLRCFVTWIDYRLTHPLVVDSMINSDMAYFVTKLGMDWLTYMLLIHWLIWHDIVFGMILMVKSFCP